MDQGYELNIVTSLSNLMIFMSITSAELDRFNTSIFLGMPLGLHMFSGMSATGTT